MQTILGINAEKYRLKLKKYKVLTAIAAGLLLLLNALFLILRSDENHTLMLTLSVATSIIFGWICIALTGLFIKPMTELYRLFCRGAETVSLRVERIDTESCRVENFDCLRVYTSDRILFLVNNGSIRLCEGREYTLFVSSGIITGVQL